LELQENYLSLDASDISSFPPGWYAALSGTSGSLASVSNTGANQKGGTKSRLLRQMKADRLASSRRSQEGSDDDGDVDARPLAKALRGENLDGEGSEGEEEEVDSVLLEPELREKCLRYLSLSVSPFFFSFSFLLFLAPFFFPSPSLPPTLYL
jgi:hypothetical protein